MPQFLLEFSGVPEGISEQELVSYIVKTLAEVAENNALGLQLIGVKVRVLLIPAQ